MSTTPPSPADLEAGSSLPFRLAVAATVTTMVMLLFGGFITTMGAGMAVEGWLDAEGHFMPAFPLEKWFRDSATFVEHTHRMIGVVLGLLLIVLVAVTHRLDRRLAARLAAWAALVAVCIQGALGGSRVLENSQDLAFLHGAVGQLTFAVVFSSAVVLAPTYAAGPRTSPEAALGLRTAGRAAIALLFGQILLGAWLRHSVRVATVVPGHDELPFPMGAFIAHAMGSVVAVVAILLVAKRMGGARDASEHPASRRLFGRYERFLQVTLVSQFLLGLGALATLKLARTELGPLVTTSLHVLGGGLLLGGTFAAALWGARALGVGRDERSAPSDPTPNDPGPMGALGA